MAHQEGQLSEYIVQEDWRLSLKTKENWTPKEITWLVSVGATLPQIAHMSREQLTEICSQTPIEENDYFPEYLELALLAAK